MVHEKCLMSNSSYKMAFILKYYYLILQLAQIFQQDKLSWFKLIIKVLSIFSMPNQSITILLTHSYLQSYLNKHIILVPEYKKLFKIATP